MREKQPGSSLGTSRKPEGTRRSKYSWSSTGLEDAISKIGNYSELVLENRHSRMEFESLYSIIQCQDAIKQMEIPDLWRIHANCHYANQNREDERVMFLRSINSDRFGYILKIMQDKGLAWVMVGEYFIIIVCSQGYIFPFICICCPFLCFNCSLIWDPLNLDPNFERCDIGVCVLVWTIVYIFLVHFVGVDFGKIWKFVDLFFYVWIFCICG